MKELDALARQLGERRNGHLRFGLGHLVGLRDSSGEEPRGMYIYGPVGRVKTMLMDLFFDSVELSAKRRTHFQVFMADVHARLQSVREKIRRGEIRDGDRHLFFATSAAPHPGQVQPQRRLRSTSEMRLIFPGAPTPYTSSAVLDEYSGSGSCAMNSRRRFATPDPTESSILIWVKVLDRLALRPC